MVKLITEASRTQMISKSKAGDNYAPDNRDKGKNRFQRRTKSSVANSVKEFNSIDMNNLFKMGILTVNINVNGETSKYVVRISFGGFTEILRDFIEKNGGKLDLRCIVRTLILGFNRDDVYVHCTCPDWCLHGDTQIKLLNNEVISVSEMLSRYENGEELWVYSTDDNGDFKPGKVTDVWISGYTDDMVEVTLDNGNKIITTPNHRYMLRDGSYCEAENLNVGQSLMPLYFKRDTKGYEEVKKNSVVYPTMFTSVYKEVASTLLTDEISGAKDRSGEDAIAIHHKDFNKLNNYPTNLLPMGVIEHWNYHSNHVKESGQIEKFLSGGKKYWSTQEARDKQSIVCKNVLSNYYANRTDEQKELDFKKHSDGSKSAWRRGCFNTEKFREAGKARGEFLHTEYVERLSKEGIRRYWDNISDEDRKTKIDTAINNLKKAHDKITGVKFTDEHKKKISESHRNRSQEACEITRKKRNETKILAVLNECISEGVKLTEENYEIVRKSKFSCGYPRLSVRFDSIDSAIKFYNINHKVAEIRHIHYDEPLPVYDISVENYNNFYVDAGVVLHNCYRFDYHSHKKNQASTSKPDDPLNRPPVKTNPHDTKGDGCKHVLLVLSNNSWVIKVASVIWNYINYIKEHKEKLYAEIIFPAIYGENYKDAYQTSLTDEEDRIAGEDDRDILDIANKAGVERTRFKQGNKQGIRFAPGEDKNQLSFVPDDDIEDTD